ncbi:hypothetical protein C8R43DRAFT_1129211 [Mycena crocata]|nr:hypothetical protein C8R43DRAFT_1129211 [Mycena crocata]
MSRTPRPRQSTLAPLESSPHFSDRIILRPIQWSNPPILLPGGRFIVYTTSDGIHCRDAESDVSIWSHYLSASASEVHSFGVEGGNATKNVKIVVCFSAQSGDNFVDILNLDLRTGVSEALLTVALPRLSVYLEPSIRGDIASIHSPRDHAYVLINWRATSCCRIRYRAKSELAMTLIPHHLVFAESTAASSSANAFAHIKICGIAALASYWYRTHDSSTIQPVSMDVLPTILTRSFILTMPSESPKSGRPQQLRMTVYESPLQNGLYRVWVYTPWSPTGATMRGSYHFNVLPGHITLRERDAFATKREWPWKGVSWYSGHRIALEGDRYCIFPPGMETSRESTLSGDCRLLSVSPYSGAIVYESKTALFISYFE